jgi:hypothetical protein
MLSLSANRLILLAINVKSGREAGLKCSLEHWGLQMHPPFSERIKRFQSVECKSKLGYPNVRRLTAFHHEYPRYLQYHPSVIVKEA